MFPWTFPAAISVVALRLLTMLFTYLRERSSNLAQGTPSNLQPKRAQLRLSITNLGDVYGFDLSGAGAYDTIFGRAAQLSLALEI